MTRLAPQQLGLSWPDVLNEQMATRTPYGPGIREYVFHPGRKWPADLAYPRWDLLIEIEGGHYANGRHVRPVGFLNDIEKYNQAAIDGWLLLRFVPDQVESLLALAKVVEAIYAQEERYQKEQRPRSYRWQEVQPPAGV